jgi:SPP1 family predicted phage head-tail adaptor
MSDAIGAARARVTLQYPTRVVDEIGGAAIAWTDAGEVWVQITARGGSQTSAFDASPAIALFSVMINRRDDVRAGWRVVWGERVLRIVGAADDGAPRMTLSCEEEII